MAVANSEDGGAYLLGKQYVSGGDLTKAETTFDQFGKAGGIAHLQRRRREVI